MSTEKARSVVGLLDVLLKEMSVDMLRGDYDDESWHQFSLWVLRTINDATEAERRAV